MDTPGVIGLLRRKLTTVDSSVSFDDLDLLQAIEDARGFLEVKNIQIFAGYVIDVTDASSGIVPDFTTQAAYIVVTQAAVSLLEQRYADLTQAGALGLIWKSGLEEESTVVIEKAYRQAIEEYEEDLDSLVLILFRATFATRVT